MGRGAYDTTDPGKDKSAMGDAALYFRNEDRKRREAAAAKVAAIEAKEKLIRSKKSRGIKEARKAEKQAASKSA